VNIAAVTERNIRGRAAVVGVGESEYYRRGQSPDPEMILGLKAILAACRDAGIDARDIDGFVSFSNDRNDSARLSAALGIRELRWSTMQWGGGGGGGSGALQQAAAAVACGFAECVVVFRALAQGQYGRFGLMGGGSGAVSGERAYTLPYGMGSPAQTFAMRVQRFFHETGVSPDTQRAVARASYHHAQNNPRATMHGRPLSDETYDSSRWIVEPFRLFDCCMENDGAAAIIVTSAERAADLRQPPAYIWAAAQGSDRAQGLPVHNAPDYATSNFKTLSRRLYATAGVDAADNDVVQSYENFTGGVVMSLVEHGFCEPEEVDKVLTFENLTAPHGTLPLNTSGGNLAECYMHGLELIIEAVRQVRGTSTSQVPDVELSLVTSGPMVTPVSNLLLSGCR
jgi:acetyl-CoA acetyltransferase